MEYQEVQKTVSLYTGANDCRFWLYLHMLPQGTDNTWFSDSLPKAKMIKLYNVLTGLEINFFVREPAGD